jgi:hypothetical protein
VTHRPGRHGASRLTWWPEAAMDWSNVTAEELVDALREVRVLGGAAVSSSLRDRRRRQR